MEKNVETLLTFKDVSLTVDYFWDNHGTEIKWNDHVSQPTYWKKAEVIINRVTSTQYLPACDNTFEFEVNQLIVNGTKIGGDVTDIAVTPNEGTISVYCKVTVGWG